MGIKKIVSTSKRKQTQRKRAHYFLVRDTSPALFLLLAKIAKSNRLSKAALARKILARGLAELEGAKAATWRI